MVRDAVCLSDCRPCGTSALRIRENVETAPGKVWQNHSPDPALDLLDNIPAMIWQVSAEGRCQYVNRAWREFTGQTVAASPGDDWTNFVHHADRNAVLTAFAEVFAAREPIQIEYRACRYDGVYCWLHLSAKPYFTADGQFGGYFGTSFDVTERREASLKLQEERDKLQGSKERLKEAQRLGKIGDWTVDLQTREVFWSKQMYRLLERDPALEPLTFEELLALCVGDSAARLKAANAHVIQTGETAELDVQMQLPSGKIVWCHTISNPVQGEAGRVIKLVGTAQDITERKLAEEEHERLQSQLRQAQKLETVGTLAGGIAHDFNNILTPILVYTAMATQRLEPQHPLREDLQRVIDGANRAKELVKQILTFSRQTEQARITLDPAPVVKEALKLLRATLPATIQIVPEISPYCGNVLADPSQLHQVLMNLCTNAFHAMRESGGTLTVSLGPCVISDNFHPECPGLKPGDYVRLDVADTGCGMDKATLERIFEPFFTTKQVGEGTGLGLSVVHGIVTSHGGAITVDSRPGCGSLFTIYLPRVIPELRPAIPTDCEMPGGDERILLVDDEPEVGLAAQRLLEGCGYQVTMLTSPFEALALFRRAPHSIDLVITDHTMPQLTGDRLARQLHEIRPVPIILMTGSPNLIDDERARCLGIQGFLLKPLCPCETTRAVRAVLDEAAV